MKDLNKIAHCYTLDVSRIPQNKEAWNSTLEVLQDWGIRMIRACPENYFFRPFSRKYDGWSNP